MMYCMNCSQLGLAPITMACRCGSTRFRGTYDLPAQPPAAPKRVPTINGRAIDHTSIGVILGSQLRRQGRNL